MNFKLISAVFSFTLLSFIAVHSQSVQEGLKFMDMEQYANARKTFTSLAASNPQNAEYQFYMGDYYVKLSQIDTSAYEGLDTAIVFFNKGINADPKYALNYVGIGTVSYIKNGWDNSAVNFTKALELTKNKNVPVLIKISEAYIYKGKKDIAVAIPMLEKAVQLEPKNTDALLLLGDAYLLSDEGNASRAIKQYNNALGINPKLAKAQIKVGKTYLAAKNYDQPLIYFNQAIAVDPSYSPAYRERAELFFKLKGYREKAPAEYKKYLSMSDGNFKSKFRFAYFCLINQDYATAIEQLNILLKEYPNERLVYRLAAYCNYEQGVNNKDSLAAKNNFVSGLDNIKQFFVMTPDTNKYISSDYAYYGKLLIKNGNDTLGTQQLLKVVHKDSSQFEIYNDLAKLASEKKKYKKASELYSQYFRYKKPGLNDLLAWGRSYYNADEFVKADTIFSELIRLKPEELLGYKWRAYANEAQDKLRKTGKAMPIYEKYIELALAKDAIKYKSDLIRGYTYIATYYLNAKNMAKSTIYWKKILAIDPSDSNATMMKKSLKF